MKPEQDAPPAEETRLPIVHGTSAPAAVAVAVDDGRSAYTVTDRAGPRVAGHLVDETRKLRLTDAEAAAELLDGTIVLEGQALHAMFAAPAKPAS